MAAAIDEHSEVTVLVGAVGHEHAVVRLLVDTKVVAGDRGHAHNAFALTAKELARRDVTTLDVAFDDASPALALAPSAAWLLGLTSGVRDLWAGAASSSSSSPAAASAEAVRAAVAAAWPGRALEHRGWREAVVPVLCVYKRVRVLLEPRWTHLALLRRSLRHWCHTALASLYLDAHRALLARLHDWLPLDLDALRRFERDTLAFLAAPTSALTPLPAPATITSSTSSSSAAVGPHEVAKKSAPRRLSDWLRAKL